MKSILTDTLVAAFEVIKWKDEETADIELWTTESLCYKQYNIMQEFKIKN